ncbi:MAG: hypothetical protein ACTS6A_01225 [Candidatus Hodgkinia cicadicola]
MFKKVVRLIPPKGTSAAESNLSNMFKAPSIAFDGSLRPLGGRRLAN